MATECQRCVAERRAFWTRVAAALGLALAIPSCACTCFVRYFDGFVGARRVYRAGDYALALGWVAFLVAGVVVLSRTASRLSRRAASRLPAPRPDPTAHYREGAAPECARHPFAR